MRVKEAQWNRSSPSEDATTRTCIEQDVEKRCRLFVHEYAIAAGCMSILPFPLVGVAFNDHALQKLSAQILQLFGLTEQQLTKDPQNKSNKVKAMEMHARKIFTSKRTKGAVVTILSKYGVANASRFVPGIGIAISSVLSLLVVEYFGHKLINECLRSNQNTRR